MLKGPFPIRDLGRVYAELVSMLFTRDPLVNESLAHAGARDTETGHPVDGVDGQTEAVSLITNGEFQRRVDVTLFLVTTYVNVVLAGPAVGEAMDQQRGTVKVKDHGFVQGKNGLELTVGHTARVLSMRHPPE